MADTKPQGASGAPILRLTGRIDSVRRVSGREGPVYVHLVRLAAPDAYTSPSTVLVRGSARHGEVGTPFDALVQVGGYGRTYETQDEETGRKVRVATADNTLTIVG